MSSSRSPASPASTNVHLTHPSSTDMSSIPIVLDSLPTTLQQRINRRNAVKGTVINAADSSSSSFVLYLPTVVLRKKHNPAFALACHLANAHNVPLIVLAVVLDDAHLPSSQQTATTNHQNKKPVVFTARRVAFVLEALQAAAKEWEEHGAGVIIRVHGPQCRKPHHLTLARQAVAVVTDEPFVHPYRQFVDSMERALLSTTNSVPFFSVDGSTTVPPVAMLQRKSRDNMGRTVYHDVPTKAWRWEERTKAHRRSHVFGAVQDGHLDAPALMQRIQSNFFLDSNNEGLPSSILDAMPAEWKSIETPSPGKRPWTVSELAAISNLKDWVMHWPGIDTSVSPCAQTHGAGGMARWDRFLVNHLADYAKLRNTIVKPHAVSRMSCYFNYGTVSIFEIVHDVWTHKKGKSSKGASKFEDEVVKWREIGYVHSFATPDYNLPSVVPAWASRWIASEQDKDGSSYSLEALESGATRDGTWNAMQRYLVETGELHNNARMTWGKTMVHWQKHDFNLAELLDQMVYVNDRYALDGLSPPSYAGLLWCLGWCDKPKGSAISEKPASRYRTGSSGFLQGKQALLADGDGTRNSSIAVSQQQAKNKQTQAGRGVHQDTDQSKSSAKRQKSIHSYFRVSG